MSGHSRWAQIKHKKAITDQKRGQLFSKLVKEITIASRAETNPNFNPRLRKAIEKAKESGLPKDTIERAQEKAKESNNLEELTIEAYGPGGIAIIAGAITDNRNRAISKIKHLLDEYGGKFAEPGSVGWAFDRKIKNNEKIWEAKFLQSVSPKDKEKLEKLLNALGEHEDVQVVFHNAELTP